MRVSCWVGSMIGLFKILGLFWTGEVTDVVLQGAPLARRRRGLLKVSRSLLSDIVISCLSLLLSTLYCSVYFNALW